jgi:hypothetical protein
MKKLLTFLIILGILITVAAKQRKNILQSTVCFEKNKQMVLTVRNTVCYINKVASGDTV